MAIERWSAVFDVNPSVGTHLSPHATVLKDGRVLVVWTADNSVNDGLGDDDGSAIHGTVFDIDGTRQTRGGAPSNNDTFLINTTTASTQRNPEVVALGNGGFAVTWEDYSNVVNTGSDIRIRIAGSNLSLSAPDYLTAGGWNNNSVSQDRPHVAFEEYSGRFYIHYRYTNPVADSHIATFNQYDASGVWRWDLYAGNFQDPGKAVDTAMSPASVEGDHALFAWARQEVTGSVVSHYSIYINNNSGAGVDNQHRVLVGTAAAGAGENLRLGIADLQNGNVMVVWHDGTQLLGRSVVRNTHQVEGSARTLAAVPHAKDLTVIATKEGFAVAFVTDDDLHVILYDRAGTPRMADVIENVGAGADPSMALLADGRIFLTWTEGGNVRAQILDPRVAALETSGTAGKDRYIGTKFGDTLKGDGEADVLDGWKGDDTLEGGLGSDTLRGGEGNDFVSYANSRALVNIDLSRGTGASGHAAGDQLSGIEGIIGSAYNDTIAGSSGAETFEGGAGNDYLQGLGGADLLRGGSGTDTVSYEGSAYGVEVDLKLGWGAGGDAQGDQLFEVEGFVGTLHDDTVQGTDGDDILNGGSPIAAWDGGNDILDGRKGNDSLIGGRGQDILYGGDGQDTLEGGIGDDYLEGGNDSDTLGGGSEDDVLVGGSGADYIDGGTGNRDTVNYTSSAQGVDVDLTRLTGSAGFGGDAQGDVIRNVEIIRGSAYIDRLGGNGVRNELSGEGGNDALFGYGDSDTLKGGQGNDWLEGGADSDTLEGGIDNDILSGDGGADLLDGGDGTDAVWYSNGSTTGVDVDLIRGNGIGGDAAGDTFAGIESFYGSYGNDTLSGSDGDNMLNGGGNVFAPGGAPDGGDDKLYGRGGNDSPNGEGGNDTLDGGADNDTLTGGYGNDTLEGGSGENTAWFSGALTNYRIERKVDGSYLVTDLRPDKDGTDLLWNIQFVQFGEQRYAIDQVATDPTDPNNPDPNDPDPNDPDPNNPDPNDPDPNNPDPNDPDPNNPDPNNPNPNNPDPSNPNNPSIPNSAPTGIDLAGSTAAEYAASGKVVGTLSATDPNANENFTFTLLNDAGGRFTLSGNQILVADGFRIDFEQAASHTIAVQVADRQGAIFSREIVIGVTDWVGEVIFGTAGNDVFKGGVGNDRLSGNAGHDRLFGGVDNDTLKGEAGNDVLGGGEGKDKLYGGKGKLSKDAFVFDTKLTDAKGKPSKSLASKSKDQILDFGPKYDSIFFDDAAFTNKTIAKYLKTKGASLDKPVKMKASFFKKGTKAADKDDFFVYNERTKKLYFDVDGSGSKAMVEIASLKLQKGEGTTLTYKDFFFV